MPVLTIALAYWPIIVVQCPRGAPVSWPGDAIRWLQNNSALSVFQVAFLPLIAGTLLAGVEPKHVSIVIARNKPLAWLLLTVVVGLAITRVVRDSTEAFRSRVIEPLEFRQDRATFLKKEKELRDAMAKGATDFCGKDGIREYTPAECYLNFTKVQFPTAPPTLWTAGGLVSWWQRLMSLQAVLIIALLIWYLLLSGFARLSCVFWHVLQTF